MKYLLFVTIVIGVHSPVSRAAEVAVPKFQEQTIDDQVQIGYGTAIGDVDGKPDILLADKKQFVWYQNPTWKKHVLAENLTEKESTE